MSLISRLSETLASEGCCVVAEGVPLPAPANRRRGLAGAVGVTAIPSMGVWYPLMGIGGILARYVFVIWVAGEGKSVYMVEGLGSHPCLPFFSRVCHRTMDEAGTFSRITGIASGLDDVSALGSRFGSAWEPENAIKERFESSRDDFRYGEDDQEDFVFDWADKDVQMILPSNVQKNFDKFVKEITGKSGVQVPKAVINAVAEYAKVPDEDMKRVLESFELPAKGLEANHLRYRAKVASLLEEVILSTLQDRQYVDYISAMSAGGQTSAVTSNIVATVTFFARLARLIKEEANAELVRTGQSTGGLSQGALYGIIFGVGGIFVLIVLIFFLTR
jgi:hypothetical protein